MPRLNLTIPPYTQTFSPSDQRTNWQNVAQMFRSLFSFTDAPVVPSFLVADLPSAASSGAGALVFVSNASGGAVLAFSDGTDWRRVTDRAVVS